MTYEGILSMLKVDLQISTPRMDEYLRDLIWSAQSLITTEGINIDLCNQEDCMLTEMYAAYLYRKRREDTTGMPRMLRWALNNRLFSQKARDQDG